MQAALRHAVVNLLRKQDSLESLVTIPLRDVCAASPLLLGLFVAGESLAATCQPISGDVDLTQMIDVDYVAEPDRYLGTAQADLVFTCDSGATITTVTPSLLGMRYVRDITDRGAAYELASGSPLFMFSARASACDWVEENPGDPPVWWCNEAEQPIGNTFRDGQPGDLYAYGLSGEVRVTLVVDIYSRGGGMTDVPMRNVGFTTTQWNTFNGRHNLNIGVRFRAQTCAVAARDVVLDPIDIMDLHTQGSGGEMPFEMAVTCAAAGRPLSLEMLDANDPNNVNSWLVPAAGSSTTGVALQLMHNGAPLQLHQQWVQGSTGTGTVQVPFSARYLRTSDPLAPGAIRAEATLLANYN